MIRSVAENIEIAADYAGLSTTFVGAAHKLVGATDADMGKGFSQWVEEKSESDQLALYGAIRSATNKWVRMRSKGDASAEGEGEQSQPTSAVTEVSDSETSRTQNSVQSTHSSATQPTHKPDNVPSPKRGTKPIQT